MSELDNAPSHADHLAARKRRSVAIAACLGAFIVVMFLITLVHLQDQSIGPCKTGYTVYEADRCQSEPGAGANEPRIGDADDARTPQPIP